MQLDAAAAHKSDRFLQPTVDGCRQRGFGLSGDGGDLGISEEEGGHGYTSRSRRQVAIVARSPAHRSRARAHSKSPTSARMINSLKLVTGSQLVPAVRNSGVMLASTVR